MLKCLQSALVGCVILALTADSPAQIWTWEPRQAIVFWNGVNGCEPSPTPDYDYIWQQNAANLMSSLEDYPGALAEPFGIMSRKHDPPGQVARDLDVYLQECRDQRKVPFIVLAPHLNIKGYSATLNPNKLDLLTMHAESIVRSDVKWTRSFTPLVLSKLADWGYAADGYAHSFGGRMAAEGLLAGKFRLRSLTPMNARAWTRSFDRLEQKGLVDTLYRITTAGDAPAHWGKAATGRGHVFITSADVPEWGSPNPLKSTEVHHNVVLQPGSTPITVEIGGIALETDLRTVLRHEIRKPPDSPGASESGVSMQMNVGHESTRADATEELRSLREEVLRSRSSDESRIWRVEPKEKKKEQKP